MRPRPHRAGRLLVVIKVLVGWVQVGPRRRMRHTRRDDLRRCLGPRQINPQDHDPHHSERDCPEPERQDAVGCQGL